MPSLRFIRGLVSDSALAPILSQQGGLTFHLIGFILALAAFLLIIACSVEESAATPSAGATATLPVQSHPTQMPYLTPTALPTYIPPPTYTLSRSATLYPTYTPRPTATPYPTATVARTPTATPTPSPTPIPTATPTPTPKPLPPIPTPTVTPALLELHDTQNTQWLKRAYRDLYRQIQRFAWVQDGLSSLETNTIDELLYIGAGEIANLRETLNLPWVQDDILEREYEAIDRLGVLGYHDTANLTSVLSLPWTQDAISKTEYDIIYWLASASYDDEKAVAAVITMPFLESPDTNDALAIRSMARLAGKGVVSKVVDHPIFQDGIAETETTLIAAAGALYRDAGEIGRLLDPGYAAIETVSSGTVQTPDLKISIVPTGTQSRPGTVEAVKDAVAFVERVMGLPLPVDHVILVLNDHAVTSDYAGTNYGFAVGYLPEYEQRQGTYEWRSLQAGLVHEVAHYFWTGNMSWVDEGVADTVGYMHGIENGLSRGQLKPHSKNCEAHDLAMLTEWDPDSSNRRYLCNYSLGRGLFQELLASLGDEDFGKRLHDLYLLSLEQQEADLTPGIAAVQSVFGIQTDIINKHWAGALNAPENRAFDEGIERTTHDLIEWNQYPTYGGQTVVFEGILLGGAVLVSTDPEGDAYRNFVVRPADNWEWGGFILPPLPGNRTWNLDDHPGDSVAKRYFFYPATRKFVIEFAFPQALGNPQDYVVIVRGFQDTTQEAVISDEIDTLGYARIRVP